MRVFDIVAEEITNEAPMGALSKIGNTVAAKFGSGKATGKLETGQIANQLRKEFDVYLGKTGQQATPDAALAFLKSKGYPTNKAKSISSAPTPAATNTPTGKPVVPASATQTPGATPAQPAARMKQSTNPINKNPVKNPAAISTKPSATPAVDYDTPTWQRKGMQPPAMQPVTGAPASTATKPAATPTQAVPAPRTKFQPKPTQFGKKVVKNSVDLEGNMLSEDIIDNMFLAAAQEAQMSGAVQQTTPAPQGQAAQPQQPAGSFASSFKAAASGNPQAAQSAAPAQGMSFDEILAAAKALPPQQQQQLVQQLSS